MDDLGRKNLRAWLQKSLASHPENDNGLVAYVEAIVGDAEGTVRYFGCGPSIVCIYFQQSVFVVCVSTYPVVRFAVLAYRETIVSTAVVCNVLSHKTLRDCHRWVSVSENSKSHPAYLPV